MDRAREGRAGSEGGVGAAGAGVMLPAACAALVGLRALSLTLDRASPVLHTIPGALPPPNPLFCSPAADPAPM